MQHRRELVFVVVLAVLAAVLYVPLNQPLALAIVLVAVVACSLIGLRAARAAKLPILPPVTFNDVVIAIAIGIGAAILVYVPLYAMRELPQLQTRGREELALPLWRKLLICADSAIIEELGFRLFLMSVFAWMTKSARIANVIAALIFAGAHLPRWLALDAGPLLLATVILVNLFAGLTMGWIYARRGLALAIVAHFFADVTAHIFAPPLLVQS